MRGFSSVARTDWLPSGFRIAGAALTVLFAVMLAVALCASPRAAFGAPDSSASASPAAASSEAASGASASAASSTSSASSSSSAAAVSGKDAPVATDPFADACTVEYADGLYAIDVVLEGGSGRASVTSPAELEVFDGRAVATLVWSSSNFDYMVVNGKRYVPVNKTGDSTFVIPVTVYDEPIDVIADTTAMSEAHEVAYTLTFDSKSVKATGSTTNQSAPAATSAAASAQHGGLTVPWIVFIVCAVLSAVVIGITIGVLRGYRNR